ncbi:MAG: alpha-amylase family glycosyl hydrolase [Bacteroidota bacterium]
MITKYLTHYRIRCVALFVFILLSSRIVLAQPLKKDPICNQVIYEMNVRQFTPEGTFNAASSHLERLQKMGVDIVWLMPVHPIGKLNRKGSLGSYYAVQDYKKINPEFGNDNDFKSFVKKAHQLKLKVIIDWVANHSAPDNVWATSGNLSWYTLDSLGRLQPTIGTDWWDVADLNYDSKEMRKEMISSMSYWLKEFDLDGFRCDVADWVPQDFWEQARAELNKVKPIFMLAEAENPKLHEKAFEMSYAWEFHHIMNDIAKGKKKVNYILNYAENKRFPTYAHRMHFTSNHDENSWNGTEEERMGEARFCMAALAFTFQGIPLIYNGQESGLNKRLRFFEKDTIDWKDYPLNNFYKDLCELHKKNSALHSGLSGGQLKILHADTTTNVLVFSRTKGKNKVYCVFNLSASKNDVNLPLKELNGGFMEWVEKKKVFIKGNYTQSLPPWSYKIYIQ